MITYVEHTISNEHCIFSTLEVKKQFGRNIVESQEFLDTPTDGEAILGLAVRLVVAV